MDLFYLIETNSFSSIWFWLLIAITWSSATHWVFGVPFDLVQKAVKEGGDAEARVHTLLKINVARLQNIQRIAGMIMVAVVSFLQTLFAALGFVYGSEFFQALFLLTFPLVFVGLITVTTARRLDHDLPTGKELYKLFRRTRLAIMFIGMASIFVTSMWGMFYLISVSSSPVH
jgi:hypothetical protein